MRRLLSERIVVAVIPLKYPTLLRVHVQPVQAKARTLPYRDPPRLHALHLASTHLRLNQVPRRKTGALMGVGFDALTLAFREAVSIRITHLPHPVTERLDDKWLSSGIPDGRRRTHSNTGRIQPVSFGQPPPCAIVLREPTAPNLDGNAKRTQSLI